MIYTYTYNTNTPIGKIRIAEKDGAITHLSFEGEKHPVEVEEKETAVIKKAYQQLKEYFAGERKQFDLPLAPRGTPFQLKVWAALRTIPYGETASYQDIAVKVGCPKGPRAIGMANNRNPIAIFIPCHRVIGADGKLVGYGGGLPIKEFLLNLENKQS